MNGLEVMQSIELMPCVNVWLIEVRKRCVSDSGWLGHRAFLKASISAA
jgi:hypothetical protein